MNRDRAVVQRFINALDDSRSLCDKRADNVAHPRLRDLLERTACTHLRIANDLAERVILGGGKVSRHGSHMGRLRTLLVEGYAQLSSDVEMAYANHAARQEAGLLRHFGAPMASIRDADLRARLRIHHREIERASMEISCFRSTMQLQTNPRAARALVIVRVPAHASTPRISARIRHRPGM